MTATDTSTSRRALLSPTGPLGLLAAVFIAVAYVGTIFPRGFIEGTSSYWQTQVQDITQHLIGYTTFLREPWKLPLLQLDSISWPSGALLTFTDSIPLFAVVMKLLGPLAPANPFGYWIALCFLLQAAATWWALAEARNRSWFVLLLAAFLAVSLPALSLRLGHSALMGQFLLTVALTLYIRDRNRGLFGVLAWSALTFVAFYVHVYLVAMTAGVMAASAADEALRRRSASPLLLILAAFIPLVLSWPITLGPAIASGAGSAGFGTYSMNLLAPFAGGTILQLPFYEPGEGQYEGRNTLGLGLLLLLLIGFLRRRAPVNPSFQAPAFGPFLAAALGIMAIYALSNEVYASSLHLLHWDVPALLDPLVSTFRASGRFFWPLGTALAVWGCFWLAARIPRPMVLAAACLVIGLVQQLDLLNVRMTVMATAGRPAQQPLDTRQMIELFGPAQHVLLFPRAMCDEAYGLAVLPVALAAATAGRTLNTGWVARLNDGCPPPSQDIAASDPANSAYVFYTGIIPLAQAQALLPAGVACQPIALWAVCRQGLRPAP
jgi:MYXO-CTERM domain-containing protein